jgi:excisionase family DNA binding protein
MANMPSTESPWLDVEGAAERLCCPTSRVYDLHARGVLVGYRDGRRLVFKVSDVDAVLVRDVGE